MMLVVFRSRTRPENEADFLVLADEMERTATSMPGFLSYKVFKAEDGERCSIIEFEDEGSLRAWREHARHRVAQAEGRKRFYQEYSLQIASPARESRFKFTG